MKVRLWLAVFAAVTSALAAAPTAVTARAAQTPICGPGAISGQFSIPAGNAVAFSGYLDDNCTPVIISTQVLAGTAEAFNGHSLATEGEPATGGTSSSSGSPATPGVSDRYVVTYINDCCGLVLTEAVLHLQWGWNGSYVTGRFVELAESHH